MTTQDKKQTDPLAEGVARAIEFQRESFRGDLRQFAIAAAEVNDALVFGGVAEDKRENKTALDGLPDEVKASFFGVMSPENRMALVTHLVTLNELRGGIVKFLSGGELQATVTEAARAAAEAAVDDRAEHLEATAEKRMQKVEAALDVFGKTIAECLQNEKSKRAEVSAIDDQRANVKAAVAKTAENVQDVLLSQRDDGKGENDGDK